MASTSHSSVPRILNWNCWADPVGHFLCSWGLHSSFDCWAINKGSEHWQSNSWIRPLSFSVVLSVPGSVMSSLKLSLKVERWWMARSRAWATVGCAKRACKPCTAEALDLWRASLTPVHHFEHSRAWTPLSSSKGGALGRCVLAELNRPFWCVPGRTTGLQLLPGSHTYIWHSWRRLIRGALC